MNKKAIALGVIALLSVLSLGIFIFANTLFRKDLTFQQVVDLGEVELNTKKTFSAAVYNPSFSKYKIAKVYTSCGCTSVLDFARTITSSTPVLDSSASGGVARTMIIKPGENVTFTFEFDSTMHTRGDEINHEIYILSTAPKEKEYIIKLTGKVL